MLRLDIIRKLLHINSSFASSCFAELRGCCAPDLLWKIKLKRNSFFTVGIEDLTDGLYYVFTDNEQGNREEKTFEIKNGQITELTKLRFVENYV